MTTSYILILGHEIVFHERLKEYVRTGLPGYEPLTARNMEEANLLLYSYDFALYIVDVNLSDSSGFEFLVDVKTVFADARMLLISGEPFELLRSQVEGLGSGLRWLAKPLHELEFFREISILLGCHANERFHGSLRELMLIDVIQIKCRNRSSCVLHLSNPTGATGSVILHDGSIVHAVTDDAVGVTAFNDIVCWKNGAFYEGAFEEDIPVTITQGWEQVLFEAVRLADERTARVEDEAGAPGRISRPFGEKPE
jgi:DNA-binding response OmpR family regulator